MPRLTASLTLLLVIVVAGSLAGQHDLTRAQPAGYPFNLTWAQQSQDGAPPARSAASMAYHPPTGTVLLFGGNDGSSSLGDTWIWHGTIWSQLSPVTSPPARAFASMVSDDTTGRLVLFGGSGTQGAETVQLDDTWTMEGTPLP